jgi:site-specific DNA-methyltransferase (adenine-specific)
MIDLRHGHWATALADVEQVDALITDPPYSARTHRAADVDATGDGSTRTRLPYAEIDEAEIARIVEAWVPRVRGWLCVMHDHIQQPWWEAALLAAGRYVFAPIPIVDIGSGVRLVGDGPSSWTVWLTVARPRAKPYSSWGTLPGAYIRSPGDERSHHRGGKPLGIMQAIVRDYTRPGDLVCDPFAGGATTLLAAAIEGRQAIGSEIDPITYALARERIARGYTPSLFA